MLEFCWCRVTTETGQLRYLEVYEPLSILSQTSRLQILYLFANTSVQGYSPGMVNVTIFSKLKNLLKEN